jgi:hypothetical protein
MRVLEPGTDLSDEQLLYLVGQTDAALFHSGIEIERRPFEVPRAVMKKLGYVSYIIAGAGKPVILDRIEDIFSSIYRKQDLAVGGHIGVYMFRDIFARIGVPRAYGTVAIRPLDCVELTDVQKRIMSADPPEVETFLDQFFDVADVQYGSVELKEPYCAIELVERFLGLARLHLHAAAAVVTGGYDYRGAVQSALLATELALKAAAATRGLTEDEIRAKFGHDVGALVTFVEASWPKFDASRVRRVLQSQPQYVPNRYSKTQPNRLEVGHTVMGAQYVAAEVVRQLSDRNFREGMKLPSARRYPP